jgi:predicted molibdopterin-dependent oxidoreductase YjgC
MRAAAAIGQHVPKLCATDTLKAFGSCRLCLVEIEGRRGYPASCTTLVADGIKVRTESPKLTQLRRDVMELYISDHPLDCVTCPANGHCELQNVAEDLDITETRYGLNGVNHQAADQDTSNPYFTFDPTMCIVCSRCVRACDEMQGTLALTIQGRGFNSTVSASQNESFFASECVSCGACVEACPTVALTEKSLIQIGRPQRTVTTTCAYCGVGCSFNAEVKHDQVVRMAPNRDGHANHGHACVKGRFAFGYATHPDRITTPMIRTSIDDPWTPVSWEEAIGHTASEFRRIQTAYGRDSIGGITSSRCTGRMLTQYNVGAQTRRTDNVAWAAADVLEIHPHDAEVRGITQDDLVGVTSRSGEIVLPANVTDRVRPGVVYTTFHFPESGANVVTTENADWATNCPEYKVTAVEIVKVNQPSAWQKRFHDFTEQQLQLLKGRQPTHA